MTNPFDDEQEYPAEDMSQILETNSLSARVAMVFLGIACITLLIVIITLSYKCSF